MIQGKAKADLEKALKAYIEDEVERRVKAYTAQLTIDGQPVELDWADVEVCHEDQMVAYKIKTPLFCSTSGKVGFLTWGTPAQMAG